MGMNFVRPGVDVDTWLPMETLRWLWPLAAGQAGRDLGPEGRLRRALDGDLVPWDDPRALAFGGAAG